MNIFEILKNNPITIVIVIVVFIGYMFYAINTGKKAKQREANFLEAHPDAPKVLLTRKITDIEPATIHTVNGDSPIFFVQGAKTGFYVLPGRNELEVEYSYTRPGIVHKSVTKSTGVSKISIEADSNREYFISFDKKTSEFTFEEL